MDRKDAIEYLEKKDKPTSEAEIKEVMKNGKIYGDPLAMCE